MANDEKLVLFEREHKNRTFTVPDDLSLVKKPEGIFNTEAVAGALGFGAIALLLAPTTLSVFAAGAIVAASALAGGLLLGITSEKVKTKNYNRALQQKAERLELSEAKGLSPSEAVAEEAQREKAGKKFLETEIMRRDQQAAAMNIAIT